MISKKTSSDVVFTLKKSSSNPTIVADSSDTAEQEDFESENILCIIYHNHSIGAAYYNFREKMLNVFEEMVDKEPEFLVCRTMLENVNPKYILAFGSKLEKYVKVLISAFCKQDELMEEVQVLPPNFFILPLKEYTFDVCKSALHNIMLASQSEQISEQEKEVFLNSMVNFDYRLSLQAVGALVRFLDLNWATFASAKEEVTYLHINQVSMKDQVLIDHMSLKALKIFSEKIHNANFKRGANSTSREGLSIFKLLSSHCKSKIGYISLKNLFLRPTNNIDILNKRLDFISFALRPTNADFILNLQENIKDIRDVHLILMRIQNSRANLMEWGILYKTIYQTLLISELCAPRKAQCKVLEDMCDSVTSELISLEQAMKRALDFSDTSMRSNRPSIKFGLDEMLDAKRLRKQDMIKHVTVAANMAANNLPSFLTECNVVYLPEMGHLISVRKWEPDCDPDQLKEIGFQFVFSIKDVLHYKSPLCVELDEHLGDINQDIIDHENRILRRLAGFVLKYNESIRKPLEIIALIDGLTSMAKVAYENNYVKPSVNNDNVQEIIESRHPLLELSIPHFQSNSYCSGGAHSRMKIITGPHGSGKSIFLKQVALCIYLAHVGSYVPAKKANIGMLYSIHSRMRSGESAAVRLSTFMIDLTQATQAMFNANKRSLIILDEFGRGTTGDEGLALLIGVLKTFLKDEFNPHVLVSTHFQQIHSYLPENASVEYLKMEHSREKDGLYYLYKITKGVSESFAFDVAEAVGLNSSLIERAKLIYQSIKTNTELIPLPQIITTELNPDEVLANAMSDISDL